MVDTEKAVEKILGKPYEKPGYAKGLGGAGSYKEHKFPSLKKAVEKQKTMKRKYGYTPKVFKISGGGHKKPYYKVVEPDSLKPLHGGY